MSKYLEDDIRQFYRVCIDNADLADIAADDAHTSANTQKERISRRESSTWRKAAEMIEAVALVRGFTLDLPDTMFRSCCGSRVSNPHHSWCSRGRGKL